MNFAIIVAAGKSKRMKASANKVFLPLLSKPMIYHTIRNFQDCRLIDEIIIVTQKNDIKKMYEIKNRYNFTKIKKIVAGGNERQDSVYNGLKSLISAKNDDIIVVHNGSNPLVKENEIVGCVNAAKKYGSAVAGFKLKDTIKKINGNFVEKTIDRTDIYQVQTPQAVKYGLFVEAFKNAKQTGLKVTDDVSLIEALGMKVRIVLCSYENIKVTTKDDFGIAEAILMKKNNTGFRIGIGQDSHRFSSNKNKKLVLGGYTLQDIGLEANSDGDVILHALFNAISTAIGERSLGYYADKMRKEGITNSKKYLNIILNKLKEKNMEINNVSIMIEAAKPRLEKHTDSIKKSLSQILEINKQRIGIAYASGEKLTSFGQGKGIQCFVAVSVK